MTQASELSEEEKPAALQELTFPRIVEILAMGAEPMPHHVCLSGLCRFAGTCKGLQSFVDAPEVNGNGKGIPCQASCIKFELRPQTYDEAEETILKALAQGIEGWEHNVKMVKVAA